ncbi:hypothetical protein HYU06_02205 [Candidatus Woesearchaeota archaeon]|nr:hypothetical protein [Candidatus Woesearchaeota archaeon]
MNITTLETKVKKPGSSQLIQPSSQRVTLDEFLVEIKAANQRISTTTNNDLTANDPIINIKLLVDKYFRNRYKDRWKEVVYEIINGCEKIYRNALYPDNTEDNQARIRLRIASIAYFGNNTSNAGRILDKMNEQSLVDKHTVVLFLTGRNIYTGGKIKKCKEVEGLAYFPWRYCVVECRKTDTSYLAKIVAHEFAHNFGADHCTDTTCIMCQEGIDDLTTGFDEKAKKKIRYALAARALNNASGIGEKKERIRKIRPSYENR